VLAQSAGRRVGLLSVNDQGWSRNQSCSCSVSTNQPNAKLYCPSNVERQTSPARRKPTTGSHAPIRRPGFSLRFRAEPLALPSSPQAHTPTGRYVLPGRPGNPKIVIVLRASPPLQKPCDHKNAYDLTENQNDRERFTTFARIDYPNEQNR